MPSFDVNNMLRKLFPAKSDFNLGLLLIGIYFLFTFGSLQGLFSFVTKLKLPFLLAVFTLLYAVYLVMKKRAVLDDATTKKYIFLCIYVVVYTYIATISKLEETALIKLFISYIAQYIIIVSTIKKPSSFVLLIDIWLVSILFSSYNGIFQNGLVWGNQWLNDENQLALMMATALPFAFILFRETKNKIKRIFYLVCILSYVAVVISAGNVSRGGVLAMSIVAIFGWLLYEHRLRNFIWTLIAVMIVLFYAPPTFFNQMDTLKHGDKEGTAADRVYLWKVGINMFKDYPILGVGPYNYPAYFDRYKVTVKSREEHAYSGKKFRRVAHSTPVEWLAENGIIGSFFLVMLQISIFKDWKKINKLKKRISKNVADKMNLTFYINLGHACAISIVAFWFASMFITVTEYPFYWCLPPFLVAWKNITLNISSSVEQATNE